MQEKIQAMASIQIKVGRLTEAWIKLLTLGYYRHKTGLHENMHICKYFIIFILTFFNPLPPYFLKKDSKYIPAAMNYEMK